MLAYLAAGCVLGLSAGLAPGPLFALLLAETLRGGIRAGAKVALAPLATDGPIIAAALLVLPRLTSARPVLAGISFAGAAFVVWLGVGRILTRGMDAEAKVPGRSFGKAVGVNFLSPYPYLFWLTVGGPLAVRAAEARTGFAVLFFAAFYGTMVGAMSALAFLASRSRAVLRGAGYVWTMRCLGAALILLAALLVREGVAQLVIHRGMG